MCTLLVSFPDHTTPTRKGSGDIGAGSWFCKLGNRLHRFVLERVWSCDGAQDQENTSMSPDPFLASMVGFGNETSALSDFWQLVILNE